MQAAAQRYCVSQQGLRSGGRVEERPQSLKRCVVINHKTTKFESNSQLLYIYFLQLCILTGA